MGPNQIHKFLHSKENHKQNEKTTYKMGENICKQCDWQGLNFQNIQTAHTTQQQHKQTIQSKNEKIWINISPKKKYRWPIGTCSTSLIIR